VCAISIYSLTTYFLYYNKTPSLEYLHLKVHTTILPSFEFPQSGKPEYDAEYTTKKGTRKESRLLYQPLNNT
jgi:hypothetical protein